MNETPIPFQEHVVRAMFEWQVSVVLGTQGEPPARLPCGSALGSAFC